MNDYPLFFMNLLNRLFEACITEATTNHKLNPDQEVPFETQEKFNQDTTILALHPKIDYMPESVAKQKDRQARKEYGALIK